MSEIKVEQFVRFLVGLGGVYDVDENGYIINKDRDEDKPVLLKVDNRYRNIMVMKDVIKDPEVVVINPLNENITESNDARWLYMGLTAGLGHRILHIVNHLYFIISSEKSDEEVSFTTDELKFAARHKDFNKKTLDAINIISKKLETFTYVWYNRKQKEAHLGSSVYDPDTIAEFPQFTPKVWKTIGKLFGEFFNVNEDLEKGKEELYEKYTVRSDLINVPKLESILNVYYKVYSHLNKYLEMCNIDDADFVIDLTEFGHHLEHLQDYYNKAKWFTGTIGSTKTETQQVNTPTSVPQRNAPFRGYEESSIPNNPFKRHSEFDRFSNQQYHQFGNQPQFGNQNQFGNQPFQNQFGGNVYY